MLVPVAVNVGFSAGRKLTVRVAVPEVRPVDAPVIVTVPPEFPEVAVEVADPVDPVVIGLGETVAAFVLLEDIDIDLPEIDTLFPLLSCNCAVIVDVTPKVRILVGETDTDI